MSKLVPETVESLRMALSALAGHKLRSGLTLLGVLVGVFSIILVMTAMRAMQNNIEQQLGSLGSKTLVVQRMPGAYFGGPEGFTKFFRRHEITFAQALAFRKKADFAPWIGVAMDASTGDFTSRFAVSAQCGGQRHHAGEFCDQQLDGFRRARTAGKRHRLSARGLPAQR